MKVCVFFFSSITIIIGFPGGSHSKESACNAEDLGSIPRLGRSPGEGNDCALQYSCLGNPMDREAWRTTVPWSRKSPGVGDGNPLQYSCLENSMEREAWQAPVHGVTESDMTEWLNWLIIIGGKYFLKWFAIVKMWKEHWICRQKNLFLVWFCNSVGQFISLICKVGIISHSVEIYRTPSVKCFANLR